jgi:predicted ATPase/DNA-binding CsgD family transcriptional regulator
MAGDQGGLADRLVSAGVTEREAEILAAVAERLRDREIADRLFLSVRTVESHVAALRRKLGVTDRSKLAELAAELRHPARAGGTAPTPLTSLIGRQHEMARLGALLDGHRLVTLVGPAGVGKTRLALHVAAASADRFADGTRFADLAPVGRELVGDTLARALDVVPQPGASLPGLLREAATGMPGLLLVVDNCEHVVADAAELVAALLSAVGGVRVLATSREPLGVPGEVSFEVPTLSAPDEGAAASAASLTTYDAVRLFVDRATTASPDFALTDALGPAVAALCRRLDGLPLAIELAASRVRSLGLAELVAHLDHRCELLSAGARTAPPRQRTLRGAIDWSYDLLDDHEQALLDRLSVFPAAFDLDAAGSVWDADRVARPALITVLPRLVDKSLLTRIGRGTARYRLLETIRAYAAERLAASTAETTTRQRHAAHYLTLAEHAAGQLRGRDRRSWIDRLTTEQPNLRAALAYAISVGDADVAWRFVAALERFWDGTGRRGEAYEWIRRTLAAGDPPATPAAVAGLAAVTALLQPADANTAFEISQTATRLAAGLDDVTRAKAARAVAKGAVWIRPELVAPAAREALDLFGHDHPWDRAATMQCLAYSASQPVDALRWGRESVALFRDIGDQTSAANTLYIMAQRAMHAGIADDEVHEWLIDSQQLADAAGSENDQLHATVGFGQLAFLRGDYDRAAHLMGQSLPGLGRIGDQRCTGRALYVLGEHARRQDRLDQAEHLLRGSVETIARAGQSIVLVDALEALAAVVVALGRPRHAAMLLGAAHTARESAGAHRQPLHPPDMRLRQSLQRTLGSSTFDHEYRHGERSAPAQALREAEPGRAAARGEARPLTGG